jgi:hypothetical protein
MHPRSLRLLLSLAAVLVVAGCATPNQPTTWRDPAYAGPGFRKIFVVGLSARDLSDQRGFENLMVSTLQRAGIAAVPGWQFVPTDRVPDEATIRAAVAKSGADAVLLARITNFSTQSQIVAAPVPAIGYGPGMYGGWYAPSVDVQYQRATVYTTLFDVRTAKPVWTYNPPTFDPATLQQDAPAYADSVADLLRSNGLLAAP